MRLLPLLLLPAALSSACGSDGVTPRVNDLVLTGQAQDSPLVLLLDVAFEDPDGDLGDGRLETFIDGRPTSAGPLSLLPLFLQSDLDLDATSGTFGFVLELTFTAGVPESGTSFQLGARLVDEQNHTSPLHEQGIQLTHDL